jgi:hypothetical protein
MIAPLIAAANVALKQKGDSVLDKIERLLQLICKLKKVPLLFFCNVMLLIVHIGIGWQC